MNESLEEKTLADVFKIIIQIYLFVLTLFFVLKRVFTGESCLADGCQAASALLKIPPLYVESIGALFSIALLTFFLLNFRSFYRFILLAGVLFEAGIYGYQLKNGIFCPLCTFFAFPLFLLFLLEIPKLGLFVFLPAVVVAMIFVLETGNLKSMENAFVQKKYTLITSIKCPHCKIVKDFMSLNNIDYKNIDIEKDPDVISILKSFGITGIPVLVVKAEPGYFEIVYGDKRIIERLQQIEVSKFSNDFAHQKESICLIDSSEPDCD